MNHDSRLILALLATVLATGCASQATLRIHSEPQGAYITDGAGRLLGTTPVDVVYPLDGNAATCVETDRFTAQWVSGVQAEIRPVVLCEAGYASTLINRDLSQPGLAEDRAFAVQIEMLQLQQAQTRAAQDAADASWAAAAAARDAADAARWQARQRYRRDRGRDRDYRDNDRHRGARYDADRYNGAAAAAPAGAAPVAQTPLSAPLPVQIYAGEVVDPAEQLRLMAQYEERLRAEAVAEVPPVQQAEPAPAAPEPQEMQAAPQEASLATSEPAAQAAEPAENTDE